MKNIFTNFVAIIFTVAVFAQAPQKLSYQAVVRNSSNALVTSKLVGMKISVLQGSSTGTAVYVEKHTPTTNSNGLLSIEIGGGTIVSGIYNNGIFWGGGPYFIKTEIDPLGSTNYTISSTSELLSVPFSNYAHVSGFAGSSAYSDTSTHARASTTLLNPAMNFVGVYSPNGIVTGDLVNGEYISISFIDSNLVVLNMKWKSTGASFMNDYKLFGIVTPEVGGVATITFFPNGDGIVSGTGTKTDIHLTLNLTDPWGSATLVFQKFTL